MTLFKKLCLPVLSILLTPTLSYADKPLNGDEDDKGIFSLVFENDAFSGTDSNYTSGVRLSWLSSEEKVPEAARWTANHLFPTLNGNKRVSLAVGQSFFTPSNKTTQQVVVDDRPYAGWLYGSIGVVADNGTELDNMVLTVGMVGPSAQAYSTQKAVHSMMGSGYPQGWHNQLHDELGVVLTYDHKWRNLYQFTPFGVGFDATPSYGFNLGNVYTDAMVGGTVRLGYDLPSDYGPPRIRPSLPGSDFFIPTKQLSGYLFAGLEGKAVARNIFLDGNTFRDSHHVEKEILVGSAQLGAAVTYHQWRVSYTQVYMTKEFETQTKGENFGTLSASYRF